MMLMNAFKRVVIENYANFSGRAGRAEYWWFALLIILVSLTGNVIALVPGVKIIVRLLVGAWSLAVFIPSLAVLVRRLHDVGKSGWFFLIIFLPIAGAIWLLVLMLKAGDENTNTYGEPPMTLSAD